MSGIPDQPYAWLLSLQVSLSTSRFPEMLESTRDMLGKHTGEMTRGMLGSRRGCLKAPEG
jgi:hypothetical protein